LTGFHELKPSSTLHAAGNIEKLRKSVATMYTRIERYCSEDPELAKHLQLAYNGILQKPVQKVVAAPPKPSLNTSDLYE
jgi:hypothetical protein